MKDKLIRFTINDDVKESFKEYCTKSNTTMSNVLIDYITILLSKSEEVLPAGEKNSVVWKSLRNLYYCPYCGEDITERSEKDRKKHVKNCKNSQNE